MVKVRWDIPYSKSQTEPYPLTLPPEDNPFYPLWYRTERGQILYPGCGYGIYWGAEFRNLVDYHPGDYEVVEACNVHLANDVKPFAYLEEMYRKRLLLKEAGDMANEAFKLGMNSTYGKLAQQAGYRNGRIPTYHQLLWAGQITAYTRASLYRAAMQNPSAIVAFATDAILSTEQLKLDTGTGLGQWTDDYYEAITIIQPGVYFLKPPNVTWKDKYRGFDKGSLDREQVIECWRNGEEYKARTTRFVGIGGALMTSDFRKHWRTWETTDRSLSLEPSGKRQASADTCYHNHLCDTMATINYQTCLDPDYMSKPYPLLWDDDDEGDLMPEAKDAERYRIDQLDSFT